MANSARSLVDMWSGICVCPPHTTIPMVGFILTGSSDVQSGGPAQSRLTDLTIGTCGHTGIIVSASVNHFTNNLGSARVGDLVTGCNIGVIITGAPSHNIN
jgi:hypothetical protein